ncbi:MAG: hypothetical protein JNN07_28650 [Verrucomicrobiales bacterium]|nr:hypothetical protein [Verrucomicrobiales bacterium]
MNNIRLIVAVVILLFAAYIVVMNWSCVIISLRNKKRGINRYHSTVPLLSLMITYLAYIMYPWPWMMVVPLLDIANWIMLWAPLWWIREIRRRKIAEQATRSNSP